MTFRFVYEPDFKRVFSAVILDSWNTIPETKMQIGRIIKEYVNDQTELVVDGTIPYRVETGNGSLAGYMVLKLVGNTAIPYLVQLRPPFLPFSAQITTLITIFIQSNTFLNDYLY